MKKFLLPLLLLFTLSLSARHLTPGFDGNEFRKMFEISGHQSDTPWVKLWMPYPTGYDLVCRSQVCGLDNRWDLWMSKDSVGVISIRGTTGTFNSWLENFYAGMVPATGKLMMDSGKVFQYKLADDSNACVHIGWTVGLASMAPEIVQRINEYYKKGVKDFYLVGHSQGGAIALLLTSYLYYEKGKSIPADITFKTYTSGTPKPGNLFYAYDFDFITRDGWAFRVINTADWVPQVPFSIEALDDLSPCSPFVFHGGVLDDMKWPARWAAKHTLRKLNRSVRHARKRFKKYLGYKSGFFVRRQIPGFPKQAYVTTLNYAACGIPIILKPDSYYHQLYPDDPKVIFRHHGYGAYLYLLNLYYPVT